MTASGDTSLFDLLDLPDPQREPLLWLARHGPEDTFTLIQSAGLDPANAQQALDALINQGHVQRLADGRVDAIHWREEEAFPIRLFYPSNLGPPPAGKEGTVQVRLPTAQAESVVQVSLDACNQWGLHWQVAGEVYHGGI